MITFKVLVLAVVAQVTAAAVPELNDENWLESVNGKSVFIFFDEAEVRLEKGGSKGVTEMDDLSGIWYPLTCLFVLFWRDDDDTE